MTDKKGNNPGLDTRDQLVMKHIDTLQTKLEVLKKRLERGEQLSVEELEALNGALEAAAVVGAAW